MPVDFLSDEQVARYRRFRPDVSVAELEAQPAFGCQGQHVGGGEGFTGAVDVEVPSRCLERSASSAHVGAERQRDEDHQQRG
ncbi:hypothetical protein ACTMTI_56160, partial [Nonomuraea sp. H19]|uniref:hypothetical protein n=1 Tax=Nonomuraea sp. H19 TaxID=3452206 RepID=UPI003F8A09B0